MEAPPDLGIIILMETATRHPPSFPGDLEVEGPVEMSTPEDYTRVRPAVWALVLLAISFALLYVGATQMWLASEREAPTQGHFLAWTLIAAGYSVLASPFWIRLGPRALTGKVVLLFLLVIFGWSLLYLGAKRAWFVGALGIPVATKPTHILGYFLTGTKFSGYYFAWWTVLGAAYSALAAFLWARLSLRAIPWKTVITFLLILVPMLAGSQVAARYLRRNLVIGVGGIEWDSSAREFVVEFVAPPGVVRAIEGGRLVPIAFVEGNIGGRGPFRSGPYFARWYWPYLIEGAEYGGVSCLIDGWDRWDHCWRNGIYRQKVATRPGGVVSVRVAWEGDLAVDAVMHVRNVNVDLANRIGEVVGSAEFDSFHSSLRADEEP